MDNKKYVKEQIKLLLKILVAIIVTILVNKYIWRFYLRGPVSIIFNVLSFIYIFFLYVRLKYGLVKVDNNNDEYYKKKIEEIKKSTDSLNEEKYEEYTKDELIENEKVTDNDEVIDTDVSKEDYIDDIDSDIITNSNPIEYK